MIVERPLGGAEQLTWLLDRHSPLHFAIAARILGKLTETDVIPNPITKVYFRVMSWNET